MIRLISPFLLQRVKTAVIHLSGGRSFLSGERNRATKSTISTATFDRLTFQNTRAYINPHPSPLRSIPSTIKTPEYAFCGNVSSSPSHIVIKSTKDIEKMRKAGEMAHRMLLYAGSLVQVKI
jgi:hypothetical protein